MTGDVVTYEAPVGGYTAHAADGTYAWGATERDARARLHDLIDPPPPPTSLAAAIVARVTDPDEQDRIALRWRELRPLMAARTERIRAQVRASGPERHDGEEAGE